MIVTISVIGGYECGHGDLPVFVRGCRESRLLETIEMLQVWLETGVMMQETVGDWGPVA